MAQRFRGYCDNTFFKVRFAQPLFPVLCTSTRHARTRGELHRMLMRSATQQARPAYPLLVPATVSCALQLQPGALNSKMDWRFMPLTVNSAVRAPRLA